MFKILETDGVKILQLKKEVFMLHIPKLEEPEGVDPLAASDWKKALPVFCTILTVVLVAVFG